MRTDLHKDDGASLVLVLIFVLVLSVVLAAVADLSSGSLRSTIAVRDVRAQSQALDAAVNGAIQRMRGDLTQGRAPGYTNGVNVCGDYNAPTSANGVVITVACGGEQSVQGQNDSGGTIPINNPFNKPSEGLFATARSPEPGITLDANGVFRVHGGVYSNSSIAVSNATLRIEGDVAANGPCTGAISSLGPPYPPAGPGTPQALDCNSSRPLAPEAYDAVVSSPPPTRTVPNCPPGYLVTLTPGTYDDAAKLSRLTSGSCSGKILWFQPGVYLFHFADSPGSHEWTVADATSNIVGGTPFGWSPTSPSRPVIPRADQFNPAVHSCVTDEDAVPVGATPSNLGVQFIFTGDSRLNIDPTGGNVELCAQPDTGNQQIAIYGVPKIAGNDLSGYLRPTGVGASGFNADVDPKGLVIGDGNVSTTTITAPSTGTLTKQVTLNGFDQLSAAALPDTAQITKVMLSVAHAENNNAAVAGLSAVVTGADGVPGAPVTLTPCFNSVATCGTEPPHDVTKYLGTVAKLRSATGNGPKITYSLTAAKNKTASTTLDGFQLDVTWVPKALSASSAMSTTSPSFTNLPGAIAPDDGSVAAVSLLKNSVASVKLTGYNQMNTGDLPPGAVISKVLARVVHQDDPNTSSVSLGGKDATGTAFADQAVAKCTTGLMECTEYVDLTSVLNTDAKLRLITAGATTGPTLTYRVTQSNGGTGTARLDGIQLYVVYQPGGLGTASGCITVVPYDSNDSATCPVFGAHGNKAYVSVHGTIYAPGAALDLKVMNGGTTVFGRGAIVRSLRLFFNPSIVYTADNITVRTPDEQLGVIHHNRIVDFWACIGRVTCTDANAKLHAVVSLTDSDASPGSVVAVKSWARRR
jgi:hypothetical protein